MPESKVTILKTTPRTVIDDYSQLIKITEWTSYKPKSEMLAMHDIFDEILIPKLFIGSNMIHFPTMKTHGHTTTTGAMKNAFGGLIPKYRHHAHKKIHEILVDLLPDFQGFIGYISKSSSSKPNFFKISFCSLVKTVSFSISSPPIVSFNNFF